MAGLQDADGGAGDCRLPGCRTSRAASQPRINNNQPINVAPAQAEATFNITVGPDVPPGVYNIVLRGSRQNAVQQGPQGSKAATEHLPGASRRRR